MAESYGFFDAEQLVDGTYDREYLAEQWANYFKLFISNGVFSSPTNQLKVVAYSGMFVKISPGWAFINGYWYHVDVDLEIEVPSNVTASPVVDGVYVRWDSAEREIKARIGVGQTTPNRVAPYYEIKLAEIAVATGATQITDANITDTRMDSSVCGLVTGIIDVIDAGNLFAQYQSIFDTWMNSTDVTFDTWRDNQEATYAQWYAAIQAEMNQNLDDFDTWFENIKGQLSTDAAGHLQNEIDEIIAQGLSGSIFTITTSQTELYGKDVTITGANVTKTGKFSNQGVAVITGFTDVGTINISSTDGLEIASTTMNIPYFGRYTATLAFWSATVNIQGDESLYGATVTVKDSDNLTVGTVTLNALDGTGTFIATKADTYTFEATYDGHTYSVEQAVTTKGATYNISIATIPDGSTVTPVNDIQTWLHCAGIYDKAYTTLDEVLADNTTLLALISDHNAVDYMVRSTEWSGNGKGLVPIMTSDTTPSGEAIGSNRYSEAYSYWKAFDGKDDTYSNVTSVGSYIGYDFEKNVLITKVKFRTYADGWKNTSFIIKGSNDGSTWTNLSSELTTNTAPTDYYFNINPNELSFRYIAMFVESGLYSNQFPIPTLQFYAPERICAHQTAMGYIGNNDYCAETLLADATWSEAICNSDYFESVLTTKVPTMTSDTTPSGECFGDSTFRASDYGYYKAFDNQDTTWWMNNANYTSAYIGYKFSQAVAAKKAKVISYYGGIQTCKVQGSNDNSSWTDLTSTITFEAHQSTSPYLLEKIISLNNSTAYQYYRVYITQSYRTGSGGGTSVVEVQFYGRA